jgi:rSAM/selenodomain-associated transferase 2
VISVIIPTYNEEAALPATLRALHKQSGDYEVLVVDGGSTDRTCEIARAQPKVRLLIAPKGRAFQMNAGAKEAIGKWLLFLHADTQLPDGALERINSFESDSSVQAGGFLQGFSGNDWRLGLISSLDNFRCRCTRIIYGDQALFVRKALFDRLGGFPEQAILEDVAFCEKLVQVVTPVLLAPSVITDSRKFVTMGVWRSFIRVLLIILCVELRLPILPRGFFRDIR